VCWDNAMVESFFGALKNEWLNRMVFATKDQARREVVKYIEGFVRHECRRLCNVGDCVAGCNAVQEMEVWPSGVAVQGEAPNYRKLRRLRAGVVQRPRKRHVVERVRCEPRRRT
jgi:Integrase core domain